MTHATHSSDATAGPVGKSHYRHLLIMTLLSFVAMVVIELAIDQIKAKSDD